MKWATAQRRGKSTRSRSDGQLTAPTGRCVDAHDVPLVHLPADAVHRLPSGAAAITCTDGQLWLTIEGDSADHVLRPGDVRRLTPGRLAVVQALSICAFAIRHA